MATLPKLFSSRVLAIFFIIFHYGTACGEPLITPRAEIQIADNLWIEKISFDANDEHIVCVALDVSNDEGHYALYAVAPNSLRRIADFILPPASIGNPLLQTGHVKIFEQMGGLLYLAIQKPLGQSLVSIIKSTHQEQRGQPLRFTTPPSTVIIRDDNGSFFIPEVLSKHEILLHKITDPSSSSASPKQNSYHRRIVTAGISRNNSFVLAVVDTALKNPKTNLVQLRADGTIMGERNIDGLVFKIIATPANHLMLLVTPPDPNAPSNALIISSTLQQLHSYEVPSFYELVRFPDSLAAQPDDSLLLVQRQGNITTNTGDVELVRYSHASKATTLAVIGGKHQVQSKVINIMSAQAQGKLFVGLLELRTSGQKHEKYLKIYEISEH